MQLLLSLTTFCYGFERKSFGPYNKPPHPPNTPCFLSPEHEVVSTLEAKITITKGFFDNLLTKKQKFRTMLTISPRYTLLGIFAPTRKRILSGDEISACRYCILR